jgi:hypothetical protein
MILDWSSRLLLDSMNALEKNCQGRSPEKTRIGYFEKSIRNVYDALERDFEL